MLHTVSLDRLLDIWSDLEQCYYEDNGFGGDTAEIYLYRLVEYFPLSKMDQIDQPGLVGDSTREAYDAANHALHDILELFAKKRKVDIVVDGTEFGDWLKEARFTHRVHIRVTPKERK